VEAVSGAAAFLFDQRLTLVAAGPAGSRAIQKHRTNTHIIDIAPPDSATAFLDGAAAARRGEMRSWEFKWQDRPSMAAACPVGNSRFLVWVREMSR